MTISKVLAIIDGRIARKERDKFSSPVGSFNRKLNRTLRVELKSLKNQIIKEVGDA